MAKKWSMPKPASVIQMAKSLGIPTQGRAIKDIHKDINHWLMAAFYRLR